MSFPTGAATPTYGVFISIQGPKVWPDENPGRQGNWGGQPIEKLLRTFVPASQPQRGVPKQRAGNYCLIPRDVTSFQYGSRLSAVIRRVACTKGKPLVGRWR